MELVGTSLSPPLSYHLISSHLFLNLEGRWGTTRFRNQFPPFFFLFSTALWDLPNSRPVHSLMLSSTGDMTIPLQFASHYRDQEVFVWSECLLDLGTDFLLGDMVLV